MNAGWKLLRALLPFIALAAIIIGALWGAYTFGVKTENARRVAEVSDLKRTHGDDLAAMDRAHRAALAAELRAKAEREAQHAKDMAALDEKFTKEIEDAKRVSDRDIAAVRAGELRLRERFTCPAPGPAAGPSGGADKAGTTTGLGDDPAPGGLRQPDAEFLIRYSDEADTVVRQLSACQAIVNRDRKQ